MKILNLIDTWETLKTDIELEKISNILEFLKKIKNNAGWKIYYYSGNQPIHPDVYKILLDCDNAICTSDSLTVFNNTQQHIDYYFAGFHTNLCLFNSQLGINKLLEIAVPKNYSFHIISDLTCGLKFVNDNDLPIPEAPDNLPFYYINPELSPSKQLEDSIQNIRNALIKQTLISTSEILDDLG